MPGSAPGRLDGRRRRHRTAIALGAAALLIVLVVALGPARAAVCDGPLSGICGPDDLRPRTVAAMHTLDFTAPNARTAAGEVDVSVFPATAIASFGGLQPGDVRTAAAIVRNAGRDPLAWRVSSTATNPDGRALAASLLLEVRALGSGCGAFNGTRLYFGTLLAGFTGAAQALSPGTAQFVCLRVSFPRSAGNGLQRASTTATFRFTASGGPPPAIAPLITPLRGTLRLSRQGIGLRLRTTGARRTTARGRVTLTARVRSGRRWRTITVGRRLLALPTGTTLRRYVRLSLTARRLLVRGRLRVTATVTTTQPSRRRPATRRAVITVPRTRAPSAR